MSTPPMPHATVSHVGMRTSPRANFLPSQPMMAPPMIISRRSIMSPRPFAREVLLPQACLADPPKSRAGAENQG